MIPNDPFVDDALLEIAADIGLAPGLSPRSLARGFETVHEEFMKIYETADGTKKYRKRKPSCFVINSRD